MELLVTVLRLITYRTLYFKILTCAVAALLKMTRLLHLRRGTQTVAQLLH